MNKRWAAARIYHPINKECRKLLSRAAQGDGQQIVTGQVSREVSPFLPYFHIYFFHSEKGNMDIYDSRYFKINKIILKTLGFWPYDSRTKKVYIRSCLFMSMIIMTLPQVRLLRSIC